MDAKRFEALSRVVGNAADRRAALRALAAALAAPALGRLGAGEAEAIPIANCKAPGKRCKKNQQCCSTRCRKGICSCSKRGRPCWAPLEGALCCSQRCKGGKCA